MKSQFSTQYDIANAAQQGIEASPSAIASAEETLSAARSLAARVEGIIDRLCGYASSTGEVGKDSPAIQPVLVRLRSASDDTRVAVKRANAALDRLDVELG